MDDPPAETTTLTFRQFAKIYKAHRVFAKALATEKTTDYADDPSSSTSASGRLRKSEPQTSGTSSRISPVTSTE
jgi:hypothetical protein